MSTDNMVLQSVTSKLTKDSIYIFIEANIDPNRDEMVEKDSIVFESEDSRSDVKLVAFGQDVILINGQHLSSPKHGQARNLI